MQQNETVACFCHPPILLLLTNRRGLAVIIMVVFPPLVVNAETNACWSACHVNGEGGGVNE